MRKTALIITSAAVVASLAGGVAAYASTQTPVAASGTPTATPTDRVSVAGTDLDRAIAAALADVGPGTVIEADIDDDRGHAYEIDVRLDAGGFVEVRVDSAFAVVSVRPDDGSGSDDDRSGDDDRTGADRSDDAVTDAAARQKAADAALAEVGGGTVVSVERSDDADHVYAVEIEVAGGEDVDVELNAAFAVVKVD